MYGKKQSEESIAKRIAHTDFSAYRTEEYRKKNVFSDFWRKKW